MSKLETSLDRALNVEIHSLSRNRLLAALEGQFTLDAEVSALHHCESNHQALVVTDEGVARLKLRVRGYSVDELIRAGELTGATGSQSEVHGDTVETVLVATSATSRLRYVLGWDSAPHDWPGRTSYRPQTHYQPYPANTALFDVNSRALPELVDAIEWCMRDASAQQRSQRTGAAGRPPRFGMDTVDFAILAPLVVDDPRSSLQAGLYPQYPRLTRQGDVQLHHSENVLHRIDPERLAIDETWNRSRPPAGEIMNSGESTAQATLTNERLIIDVPSTTQVTWRGKPIDRRVAGKSPARFIGHVPLECLKRVESATLPVGAAIVCTAFAMTDRYAAEFSIRIPVSRSSAQQVVQTFADAVRVRWMVYQLPPTVAAAVQASTLEQSQLGRVGRLARASHRQIVPAACRPIGHDGATGKGFSDQLGKGEFYQLELAPPNESVAPSWHPDPTRLNDHRYWNGHRWTGDVANGGVPADDERFGPRAGNGTDVAANRTDAGRQPVSPGSPWDPPTLS